MSKMDPGSNYAITDLLDAASRTVATYYTTEVDHINGEGTSFLISVGTFATSFVATVQTSSDNITYVDQTADGSGNDVSVTLTEAGSGQLDVPQPLNRYSRVKLVLGGTNVCSVTGITGPYLIKEPAATS